VQRHETDATSLVFGLLALAAAAMWPLNYYDVLAPGAFGVVVPLTLVVVGVAGLLASLRRARRPKPEVAATDVAALEAELGLRHPSDPY
jgi:hypothetical protein